jgi:hypothetical protein
MDDENILVKKITYTATQKEHIKNYRMKNKDVLKIKDKEYRIKNKERLKENRHILKTKLKADPEYILKIKQEYNKKKDDPEFKKKRNEYNKLSYQKRKEQEKQQKEEIENLKQQLQIII